jgi:hypothetical protein
MEIDDPAECPFCLGRMQLEDRDGESWMVCPNGCPTELQIPVPNKLPVPETQTGVSALQARRAGSSK